MTHAQVGMWTLSQHLDVAGLASRQILNSMTS